MVDVSTLKDTHNMVVPDIRHAYRATHIFFLERCAVLDDVGVQDFLAIIVLELIPEVVQRALWNFDPLFGPYPVLHFFFVLALKTLRKCILPLISFWIQTPEQIWVGVLLLLLNRNVVFQTVYPLFKVVRIHSTGKIAAMTGGKKTVTNWSLDHATVEIRGFIEFTRHIRLLISPIAISRVI